MESLNASHYSTCSAHLRIRERVWDKKLHLSPGICADEATNLLYVTYLCLQPIALYNFMYDFDCPLVLLPDCQGTACNYIEHRVMSYQTYWPTGERPIMTSCNLDISSVCKQSNNWPLLLHWEIYILSNIYSLQYIFFPIYILSNIYSLQYIFSPIWHENICNVNWPQKKLNIDR